MTPCAPFPRSFLSAEAGAGGERNPDIHSANAERPPEYKVGFQQSKSFLCLHTAAAAQSNISG